MDDGKGGYHNLEVYQIAHDLAVKAHAMTLKLPTFETYEEGSQLRRCTKRISAGIVEGYALRKYRDQYLHYLYRSLGSSDESQEHLRFLWETRSLTDREEYTKLLEGYESLSRKLSRFIVGVERTHRPTSFLRGSDIGHPASDIEEVS